MVLLPAMVYDYNAHSAEGKKESIMNAEEAWRIEKKLIWDSDHRTIHALIQSKINIREVAENIILGSITDINGTILEMYGKESVIMARFGYESGEQGNWDIVSRPSKGLFSFTIPEKYLDADHVKLWVNSNSFVIQPLASNSNTTSYYTSGTRIDLHDDGNFIISGLPPLSFVNVAGDDGLDMQEFPVYQSQIHARITSSMDLYGLSD